MSNNVPSNLSLNPSTIHKTMNTTKTITPIIIKIIPSHKKTILFFSTSRQISLIHSFFFLSKIYPLSQYEGTHLVKFQFPSSQH